MWFWKNNFGEGEPPQLGPFEVLNMLLDIGIVYYGSSWICEMIGYFILAIMEFFHPTGRFGHLHW